MKHLFDQRINVSAQQSKVLSKQNAGKKIPKMIVVIILKNNFPHSKQRLSRQFPSLSKL